MYFNPQVKEKRDDFFNFEALQEKLKRMIAYGFVEKRDQMYYISDPLLEAAF
jgi:hypothetical protein